MGKPETDVAIVAVAKDEAAYIHEWIHHHLYFGFSHIFVGINRTSDCTKEVLSNIQIHNKNIHFFDVDWIDQARRPDDTINEEMQFIAYSYLIDTVRRNYPDIEYCALLDVDEFWCSNNFKNDVRAWISSAPYFDTASFYWACQFGDKTEFAKPFANQNARFRGQIKSIINLKSDRKIDRMRAHSPLFTEHEKVIHIDADGNDFQPRQGLKSSTPPKTQPSAFILHRMTRSETEYLSNLRKGMLEIDTPIKINRNGYWHTQDKRYLGLDTDSIAKYHASLDAFISECGLYDFIMQEREKTLEEAHRILDVSRDILIKNIHHYLQTLYGTSAYPKVLEKLQGMATFKDTERQTLLQNADLLKQENVAASEDILGLL